MALIKCKDPSQIDSAIVQIQAALPGYMVNSSEEFFSLLTNNSPPGLDAFIKVVVGIAVIIDHLQFPFPCIRPSVSEPEMGFSNHSRASKFYIINLILREPNAPSLLVRCWELPLCLRENNHEGLFQPSRPHHFPLDLIATALVLLVEFRMITLLSCFQKDPLRRWL
jgi:hypothetical protein